MNKEEFNRKIEEFHSLIVGAQSITARGGLAPAEVFVSEKRYRRETIKAIEGLPYMPPMIEKDLRGWLRELFLGPEGRMQRFAEDQQLLSMPYRSELVALDEAFQQEYVTLPKEGDAVLLDTGSSMRIGLVEKMFFESMTKVRLYGPDQDDIGDLVCVLEEDTLADLHRNTPLLVRSPDEVRFAGFVSSTTYASDVYELLVTPFYDDDKYVGITQTSLTQDLDAVPLRMKKKKPVREYANGISGPYR
ncbi:hypothetical protein KY359_01445 [Candidatus Woesearchaeota archaeon]|nr:hypothetical protein [Candidatus Woesearchaeota archaeon]